MEALIRLFEWEAIENKALAWPYSQPEFISDFQEYLNTVWESRNWYKEEESKELNEERSAAEQRFFTFSNNTLKARNYVGVVQFKEHRLEIYPKIFQDCKERDFKSYFQHLMYWLSYCRRINFPVSRTALDDLPTDDFLEALIYIFAHYTEELLTTQPFQAFEEVLEETPFLRGRLAMAEYFQQNITTGRWQYFQSEYEPLVYDNLFNRIVKYTARILTELSSNEKNKVKLLQIQFLLDEVTDCVCVSSDCDKVKLNPLYSDLADILKLCKVFLSNLTINNDAPSESNFCFLLPMEYVFEDFIFSFIQEHFPELNAKEQTGGFLAKREGKNVFKIKNDILIEKRELILDTKYKIRHDVKDGKDGVGQTDLYQMLAYAVKRGYHDVLLLYPERPNNVGPESKFTIESPFTLGKPIQIEAQNINITNHKIGNLDSLIFQQLKKVLYKNL